jgi:predicted heme/steroid binding protein/uncharacterized membrane protein
MGNAQEQRQLTRRELKEFNGKAGEPTYVAFKGKVYDLSGSRLWVDGTHLKRHFAGDDLSEHIINAPHGQEVLRGFPVIGELTEETLFKHGLAKMIEKLHPHPIMVHFAMAYAIVISLLCLLYILTQQRCFEAASYYLLALGAITTPGAGISGFFTWKITYEGRMTLTFFRKIVLTVILFIVITLCFVIRTMAPDVLLMKDTLSYIYLALVVSLVPVTVMLGYYGGKIVYA